MINEINEKESESSKINSKSTILPALMWIILSVQSQTANALDLSDFIQIKETDHYSSDTRYEKNRKRNHNNRSKHHKHYPRHNTNLEELRLKKEILELELKIKRQKRHKHHRNKPRYETRKVYTIKCKWLKCRKEKEYKRIRVYD